MAAYTRITYNERCRIRQMLKDGLSQNKIARRLGRGKSTISTEIRRKGMTVNSYHPSHAQQNANFKRGLIRKNRKIKGELEELIQLLMLERRWSPEQISESLKLRYPSILSLHVSTEAIYKYVYRSPNRDIFCQALRRKRKSRKSRKTGEIRRGGIRNKVSIRERDPEAETRLVPGHWEADLIVGLNGRSAIGTLVERTTRFVILVGLENKTSDCVVNGFLSALENHSDWFKKSLAYDQGTEMAQHERFTQESGIPVYFADPGSPWQRPSNENTNGLLREFFPKKTDLSLVTDEELRCVEKLMNTRPRKVLEYLTPQQRLAEFEAHQ